MSNQGYYHNPGIYSTAPFIPPAFCYRCGKPFPWLASKIKAAVELAQIDEVMSEEESTKFSEYVTDISKDTPSSNVSAKKITILLKKFSQSAAMEMRALLVDIASESIKKTKRTLLHSELSPKNVFLFRN
ncbi:MAG: DUF2321 domain-containing protein [Ignavibacteriales bacterium]|nr:DUF2321 domain-containing protein [Ignavibacteriales bacterium]